MRRRTQRRIRGGGTPVEDAFEAKLKELLDLIEDPKDRASLEIYERQKFIKFIDKHNSPIIDKQVLDFLYDIDLQILRETGSSNAARRALLNAKGAAIAKINANAAAANEAKRVANAAAANEAKRVANEAKRVENEAKRVANAAAANAAFRAAALTPEFGPRSRSPAASHATRAARVARAAGAVYAS